MIHTHKSIHYLQPLIVHLFTFHASRGIWELKRVIVTTKDCWKPKNNKLLWWTYDKAAGGGWVFKKVQIFQQDLWPEPGNNTLKSSWLKLQTSTQKLWTFVWIQFSQCRATNPLIFWCVYWSTLAEHHHPQMIYFYTNVFLQPLWHHLK